jgi:cytochrome b561
MKRNTYSRGFRLWHWLNAIAIFGLLGTVLLRKTFLSYKTNGQVILDELAKLDIAITLDAAKAIARTIRVPMWEWHYIFGFMLAILLVYRIVLHFKEKSLCFMDEFKAAPDAHEKGIYLMYGALYGFVILMSVTGLFLYFGKGAGLERDILHPVKEFHEVLMWFFVLFVPAHIIGLFVAENRGEKGIVSDMIGEDNGA